MSSSESRGPSGMADMPPKKSPVSTSANFPGNLSKAAVSAASSQLLSRTLSSVAGKGSLDLSAYFSNMEQSSLLLKQQQQLASFHQQQQQQHKQSQSSSKNPLSSSASSLSGQQKAYEALLADFNKSNDSIAAKINSAYSSHDAKVSVPVF